MTKLQREVIHWLVSGRTGVSSECMAMWLAFGERTRWPRPHPRDPADLNRCLNLLHLVKGLRPKLPKMAEVSPEWAALVARWSEVEAVFMDEAGLDGHKSSHAPKTYELMREIIYGCREKETR